jgi:hypothetical protein
MPKLRLHSPASIPGLGSMLDIPGDDVTVGRSPENQLVIPENTVSLRHARIRRTAEGWVLTDWGDTNGIWIGVKRVTQLQLRTGQLFRIGGVAVEFIDDAADSLELGSVAKPLEAHSAGPAGDSGIRGARPHEAADDTVLAPPAMISSVDARRDRNSSAQLPSTASSPKHSRLQRMVAGMLALIVLGFAVTLGGWFALRWLTTSRNMPRIPAWASGEVSSKTAPTVAPPAPDALLVDKTVDNVGEEQRVEVPEVLSLVLPQNALHTPTHLVVARAQPQGSPFCGATDFAGGVFEIATSSNRVWAQPGTLELSVDVDQLAKTRVPALAIGLLNQQSQQWQLLPTEYDSVRRIARAQLRQPGHVALFFVRGPEQFAASEHFALLFQPKAEAAGATKPAHPPDRSTRTLNELEAALTKYRSAGYRVPNGLLWACILNTNIPRTLSLLPVAPRSELQKGHSQALARAAFAALSPAYFNSRSTEGREFWFEAMLDAIANHAIGTRSVAATPTHKRLANSLLAEDWPAAPLFLGLVPRFVGPQVDLFRIWTDTTHVMAELDAKPGTEGQAPVLAIELALQQETQKSLLDHYSDFVRERLLASPGNGSENSANDRCPSAVQFAPGVRSGTLQLDVPGQYTARWACLSVEVTAAKYRSITTRLAAELPAGFSLHLLRVNSGQPIEIAISAAQSTRIDLAATDMLLLFGVSSGIVQSSSITLRYEDATLGASLEPAGPRAVRPGQNVPVNLQLSGILPDLRNLEVQWDHGDGSPKDRASVPVGPGGVLRVEHAHVWPQAGKFSLRVSVFDPASPKQEMGFATQEVTAEPVVIEPSVTEPNPQAQTDRAAEVPIPIVINPPEPPIPAAPSSVSVQ